MSRTGIDSNALTYFINATNPPYDLSNVQSHLKDEYIAIVQGYLYPCSPYVLVPTVRKEYNKIVDETVRKTHERYRLILFIDGPRDLNDQKIENRREELFQKHPNYNDCQILAEAEASELDYLLSIDGPFINRLAREAKGVKLMKPSGFIKCLKIKSGQRPKLEPDSFNPLSQQSWWKK